MAGRGRWGRVALLLAAAAPLLALLLHRTGTSRTARGFCNLAAARARGPPGRAILLRAAAEEGEPYPEIAEEWQEEAERCWSLAPQETTPRAFWIGRGWIASMLPPDRDYSRRSDGISVIKKEGPQRNYNLRQGRPPEEPARMNDLRKAKQLFDGAKGTFLDAGCGDAFFARHFARKGTFDRVVALDLSWAQLTHARELCERSTILPTKLNLIQGDVEALPFRDGSITGAVWALGMHLSQDPKAAFASLCRVLEPNGGTLFATGYNEVKGCESAEDVAELAKEAGFTQARCQEVGGIRYMLLAIKI